MPFVIGDLIWDDWNEEHISRHQITPEEVEEVCLGQYWLHKASGRDKRAVYGQTSGGRYLLIILAHRGDGFYYAVTAREMNGAERRRYQEWNRSG